MFFRCSRNGRTPPGLQELHPGRSRGLFASTFKGTDTMDKQVTLIANTELTYGGGHYGVGMQFVCDAQHAAELVKSQQASEVPAEPRPMAKVDPFKSKTEP